MFLIEMSTTIHDEIYITVIYIYTVARKFCPIETDRYIFNTEIISSDKYFLNKLHSIVYKCAKAFGLIEKKLLLMEFELDEVNMPCFTKELWFRNSSSSYYLKTNIIFTNITLGHYYAGTNNIGQT